VQPEVFDPDEPLPSLSESDCKVILRMNPKITFILSMGMNPMRSDCINANKDMTTSLIFAHEAYNSHRLPRKIFNTICDKLSRHESPATKYNKVLYISTLLSNSWSTNPLALFSQEK